MKLRLSPVLAIVIFLSPNAFAQSVVITPKKTIYTRRKPTEEYKKTFIVTRPIVKASTPALSKKIEIAISFEKNSNFKLSEEMGEYQWLEEAGYEVVYNKNGLLDIILSSEGSGAYPSMSNNEVVINTKSGNRVKAVDIFTNLVGLAAKVRKNQLAEIKKAKEDYKKDPDSADFDGSEYFDTAKFTAQELNDFSVSDKGVSFKYDYGFPHVALALQPDGTFFYEWTALKPFIKRGGLLEKLVR